MFLVLDAAGLSASDARRIAVDPARLATFMAGQGGQSPDRDLARMSPTERRDLVQAYVREEALYREAVALGLDRNDGAIRRRLAQSLEFSLQPGEDDLGEDQPSETELRSFLAAHGDRYVESPRISFAHVFFDKRKRGEPAAAEAARKALSSLGTGDWLAVGDRYPYRREYEVTEDALASDLGRTAARRVFALPVQPRRWKGPIESDLGFHLIRIDRRTAAREPDFEEIRAELVAAVIAQKRDQGMRRAIDRIVAEYEVDLSPALARQLE